MQLPALGGLGRRDHLSLSGCGGLAQGPQLMRQSLGARQAQRVLMRVSGIIVLIGIGAFAQVAHAQTTVAWPRECRELPSRIDMPEKPPMDLDSLRPWVRAVAIAINGAEPDFVTPLTPIPDSGRSSVRQLWQKDSSAVEWALAQLTADGAWEGRWPNQMYGRYYEELSGRPGPILFYLRTSNYPQWLWAFFAVKPPVSPAEERVFFWHECMALWPLMQVYADSAQGGALLDEAFPPWLGMAYSMAGSVFRFLSPEHQALIRGSVTPYLIDAIGLHPR